MSFNSIKGPIRLRKIAHVVLCPGRASAIDHLLGCGDLPERGVIHRETSKASSLSLATAAHGAARFAMAASRRAATLQADEFALGKSNEASVLWYWKESDRF